MKKYLKNSNNLQHVNTKIRVFDVIPQSLSDIKIGELYIIKDVGLYIKTQNSSTKVLENVQSSVESFEIGILKAFIGNSIPNGWLECDGSTFDTTLYSDLFSYLGDNHVPDFRECTMIGYVYDSGAYSDDSIEEHCHGHVCGTEHCHCNYGISHCHSYCTWGACLYKSSGTGCLYSSTTQSSVCTCGSLTNRTGNTTVNVDVGVFGSDSGNASFTRNASYGVKFIIYAGVQ